MRVVIHKNGMLEMSIINVIFLTNVENCGRVVIYLLLTLDYVFTEEENLIKLINYEAPLGKSDHVVLTWKLLLATPTINSSQVKFNFHKEEYGSMRNSLKLFDWKERWKGKAVDEMWSDFTKILYELVKMHIPLKRERKKKKDYLSRYGEKLAKEVARGAVLPV